MNKSEQAKKAKRLRELHHADALLVLPNIWNPLGARMLQAKGFPAIATASAAIGPSLGYADGEKIERSTLLYMVDRITRSVDVPVTVDYEAGYAASLSELETSIREVIEAGAVGINFEDSKPDGSGQWSLEEQAERIATVRQAAEATGVSLVINARPDSFANGVENALDDTVARASAYVAAGADCIYPIGPGDVETVTALRSRIAAPINILGSPNAAPLKTLHKLGVNRVSMGPFVFRSIMHKFVNIVDQFKALGSFDVMTDEIMSGADVNQYLFHHSENSNH